MAKMRISEAASFLRLTMKQVRWMANAGVLRWVDEPGKRSEAQEELQRLGLQMQAAGRERRG